MHILCRLQMTLAGSYEARAQLIWRKLFYLEHETALPVVFSRVIKARTYAGQGWCRAKWAGAN